MRNAHRQRLLIGRERSERPGGVIGRSSIGASSPVVVLPSAL